MTKITTNHDKFEKFFLFVNVSSIIKIYLQQILKTPFFKSTSPKIDTQELLLTKDTCKRFCFDNDMF